MSCRVCGPLLQCVYMFKCSHKIEQQNDWISDAGELCRAP